MISQLFDKKHLGWQMYFGGFNELIVGTGCCANSLLVFWNLRITETLVKRHGSVKVINTKNLRLQAFSWQNSGSLETTAHYTHLLPPSLQCTVVPIDAQVWIITTFVLTSRFMNFILKNKCVILNIHCLKIIVSLYNRTGLK